MFNQLDESKKLRIINAALSEFADKGYNAASTNEIARKAQISKGSLFHYFGTKEKLYTWLIEYGIKLIETALYANDQLRQEDFIEVLVQSALIKMKVFQEYPDLKDFFLRIYQTDQTDEDRWAGQLTQVMSKFQSTALDRVDTRKFRNDMQTAEVLRISYWIIDGMGKDYIQAGQGFGPDDMLKLTSDMMATLKKLIYKEEYQ